jgi:hypothetical protein
MIDLSTVIKRDEHTVSALMDDGLALMSVKHNSYFILNAVSRRIWELLESPLCVKDLCRRLMDEFFTGKDRCQTDVLEFLTRFHRDGLIDIQPGE